jgi:hypothetical protein
MPIKNEVAQAVYAMLEALTIFRDRKELTARIERAADDFNGLLSKARQVFPGAALVHQMEPLSGHDRVIVLVARLAVLKSAIDSELIGLNRGYVLNQTFRYWLHSSGTYYAVEFRRGKLSAVCGPIPFEDIDVAMLPHLPYQRGAPLQWVEQHRSEFTVYTDA